MKMQNAGLSRPLIGETPRRNLRWAIASILCCAGAQLRPWRNKVAETPTASQTVGPFFSIGLDSFLRKEVFANGSGDRVTVRGRVLDGHDQPVPDAVLEIWAPGTGTDECTAEGYPVGFGRVATNDLGEFDFVVPRPPGSEHD